MRIGTALLLGGLGLVALAGVAKKEVLPFEIVTRQSDNGTWRFLVQRGGIILHTDPGPFASQDAAIAAGNAWVDANG